MKKSQRYKELGKRTKRKLNFVGKELEDQFPKESTPTTTQAPKPSVSLPIPDFNLPILNKPKRTKSRAVKKVKLSPLKSKSLVKAQSKVNKGDYLYLCDIKEFSDLNLYLDELEEVRGIDAYRNLPERLSIPYTGSRVHPRPYWLMEFMDDKGVRRFFKLEDKLSISSNETLLEMQEKPNLSESDELEFYRQL
ncbi:hypothetical protein AgCh_005194 [Apium graveolens]